MRLRSLVIFCFVFFLPSFNLSAQNPSERTAVQLATGIIRPEKIRAHIRFLSDSLLQGRAPGTPGYDIAARYVATQLEGMGLHPGVSGGGSRPCPSKGR